MYQYNTGALFLELAPRFGYSEKNHQEDQKDEKCHLLFMRQESFNSNRFGAAGRKIAADQVKQSFLCPQTKGGVIS